MAGSVNRAFIIGHVGRDPETKTLQSGSKVTNFSVATTDSWKTGDGDRQERTTWHNVVIWNEAVGEIASRFVKKGSQICIEASIENREYTDKDDVKRQVSELVIRPYSGSLTLLDKAERPTEQPGNRRDRSAKAGPQ